MPCAQDKGSGDEKPVVSTLPPIQPTPNIVDLKMGIDAHLDHTFGVIKVIFEFLPLS